MSFARNTRRGRPLKRIRLLLATFAFGGTAFIVGLSPVMAQDEDVTQEQAFTEETQEIQDEALPPDEVVLFDEEGNAFSCSSADTNADGVSELVCVPQTAAMDETATTDETTTTDDTSTTDVVE
jgi:hypothetical protein